MKDGGHFGFIIPNKFVRANYGEPLRTFLTEQVCLERLVDFGDLPVFRDATTYPMIVLTSNQQAENLQRMPVKYASLKHLPTNANVLAQAITEHESLVPPSTLTGAQWSLQGKRTSSIQAIVEKLRNLSTPLGEYVGEKLFRGILTGLNEAFVIDRQTRDQLIAADSKSAEIIKPFVVGRDVKRYRVDYQPRYLIFTRHGTDLSRYKAIEQHLLRFRAQLEPRPDDWNDILQGEWQGRKPGSYKWYEIQDNIAYYQEFEKPKIMFPDIAIGCRFALDREGVYSTNTTYFMPIDESQRYLLPLLNSSLIEFFFRTTSALIRGGYLRFFTQYVIQVPISRIAFTTPADERATRSQEGITLYESNKYDEVLAFVEACLASQPEQSDVVHDLLVHMAEQMIDLHKRRKEALEDFLLGLEGVLSRAELEKLGRLWTPPNTAKTDDAEAARKLAEAQAKLGALALRTLDLDDDIGYLNEEQWKWLLKKRLSKPDMVYLTKVYRTYQPSIAALEQRILLLDRLIDQVVYRLYGLTVEERAVVEEVIGG